jgi:hypothetical protein
MDNNRMDNTQNFNTIENVNSTQTSQEPDYASILAIALSKQVLTATRLARALMRGADAREAMDQHEAVSRIVAAAQERYLDTRDQL